MEKTRSSSRTGTAATSSASYEELSTVGTSVFREGGTMGEDTEEQEDKDEVDFPDSEEEKEDEQTLSLREEVSSTSHLQKVVVRLEAHLLILSQTRAGNMCALTILLRPRTLIRSRRRRRSGISGFAEAFVALTRCP